MASRTRIVNRARALRKATTEPEIMLWSRLKGRGTGRPIFHRQYAFGSLIFWLAKPGLEALRFGAGAVRRDLSAAADAVILRALERIAGG